MKSKSTLSTLILILCIASSLTLLFLAACGAPSSETPRPVSSTLSSASAQSATPTPIVLVAALPTRTPVLSPVPWSEPTRTPLVYATRATAVHVMASTPDPQLHPVEAVPRPPTGQYVLIDVQWAGDGTGVLPHQFEQVGPYFETTSNCQFDPVTGKLGVRASQIARPLAPEDWGIVCERRSVDGTAGRVEGDAATLIERVPFSIELNFLNLADSGGNYYWRQTPLALLGVAADGTVDLSIDGQRVALSPGQSWERGDQVDVVTATSSGTYRDSHRITNYGWQPRALVGSPSVSSVVTTEGGTTWALYPVDADIPNDPRLLSCPTDAVCYAAVGNGNVFLSTRDGGQTWARRQPPGTWVVDLHCPAAEICLTVDRSQGRVLVTADGGGSWQTSGTEQSVSEVLALDCPTASQCYVVGGPAPLESVIARTPDAGVTWQVVTTTQAIGLTDIDCPTVDVCYATGVDGGGSETSVGILLVTTDGGRTWTRRTDSSAPYIEEVRCTQANSCFVAIGGLGWWRTTDGGQTWATSSAGLPAGLALGMPICRTPESCFAVIDNRVYQTQDGGFHWTAAQPFWEGNQRRILALDCPSATTCIGLVSP